MHKGRLEAFSDGVIAIIITIMVLELKAPHEPTLEALVALAPKLGSYVLSFTFVGIYWNNHHHLMQVVKHVNGGVLWANMHLLFWLSLVPFVTDFMGENHFAPIPVAAYALVLLVCGFAYWVLARVLVSIHDADSVLAKAIGEDRKGTISLLAYSASVPLAWVNPMVSCALFVLVALMWLLPDPRIEKAVTGNLNTR
jgi:uncharacterized membrane protein